MGGAKTPKPQRVEEFEGLRALRMFGFQVCGLGFRV